MPPELTLCNSGAGCGAVIIEAEVDYLELLLCTLRYPFTCPHVLLLVALRKLTARHFGLKSAAKVCLCNAAWTNSTIGGIPGMLDQYHVALAVPAELQRTCPVPVKILLRRKDILISSVNRSMNYAKLCVIIVATKNSSKRCVTV